jgi:thioredoxin 1
LRKHGIEKRIHGIQLVCLALSVLVTLTAIPSEARARDASATVESIYPGLASGVLTYARLGDLAGSTLLRSGRVEITTDEFNGEVVRAPEALRDQLRKNGFFLLEQLAARRLLVQMAKEHAGKAGTDLSQTSEGDIVRNYLRRIVDKVEVTEADVKEFYQKNKDLFGGAKLDQVRKQLHQYILHQKQEQNISEHIRTLGQRVSILVSASWIKEQSILARDNPVDKSRMSGRPTLVDFGASGCRPCDMMAPILNDIKKKYEGKLNVVFVHVREEQILAARYGVQGIPMQIFFDKDGKEVFRHTGFFSQKEIEKKLGQLGER